MLLSSLIIKVKLTVWLAAITVLNHYCAYFMSVQQLPYNVTVKLVSLMLFLVTHLTSACTMLTLIY